MHFRKRDDKEENVLLLIAARYFFYYLYMNEKFAQISLISILSAETYFT